MNQDVDNQIGGASGAQETGVARKEINVYGTEVKYLSEEIERLKRQVEVLRELAIDMKNTQYHARVNEALAAADKIAKE